MRLHTCYTLSISISVQLLHTHSGGVLQQGNMEYLAMYLLLQTYNKPAFTPPPCVLCVWRSPVKVGEVLYDIAKPILDGLSRAEPSKVID